MQSPFLFVYGTLKSEAINTNAQYLHQHAQLLGRARWPGRLYLISNYPGAVPPSSNNEFVNGELWRLNDPDQLLATLDVYEECAPSSPVPHEYKRSLESVQLIAGEKGGAHIIQAWVYIYNLDIAGFNRIDDGNFVNGNHKLIRRVL